MYLWIECSKKKFPAEIKASLRSVEFEYYANMVSIDDLKNFDEARKLIKEERMTESVAKKSMKHITDAEILLTKVDLDMNFNKPSAEKSDVVESGPTAILHLTKKKQEDDDIDFQVFLFVKKIGYFSYYSKKV